MFMFPWFLIKWGGVLCITLYVVYHPEVVFCVISYVLI